jgi:nicotinamidase-related amidase
MSNGSQQLISAARCQLMVIDLQEKLLPAMLDWEDILHKTEAIVASAIELGVPLLVSEQYPQGLGPTVKSVADLVRKTTTADAKVEFSCMANAAIAKKALEKATEGKRDQFVILGIEAHVCVLQTALDLIARGVQVFVVADAIGSRKPRDYQLGLERMRQEGVRIVSSEMLLFEWVGKAGTESFKAISQRVKAFG